MPCLGDHAADFKIKTYLRSGARVRHGTPHPARPRPPFQGEIILRLFQRPPQTEPPEKRRCRSDRLARRSYKFFVQHIVHCSSLNLDQTDTKIRQGASSLKDLQTIPSLPQTEKKPKNAQNAIPQAKLQPLTPIKLLFDFSLIYTVLRKAGNEGEQKSSFPPEAFLSKHSPAPQHPQTDQKMPGPESTRDKEPKPLNFNSAWANFVPILAKFYLS